MYIVIKIIKGRAYRYQQRSYREAGRVRTVSIYLGPEDGFDRLPEIEPGRSRRSTSNLKYVRPEAYPAEIGLDRFPHHDVEPVSADLPFAMAQDDAPVAADTAPSATSQETGDMGTEDSGIGIGSQSDAPSGDDAADGASEGAGGEGGEGGDGGGDGGGSGGDGGGGGGDGGGAG